VVNGNNQQNHGDAVKADLAPLGLANGNNALLNVAFSIELDALPDLSLISGFAALAGQLSNEGFDPPLPVTTFTMMVNVPTGMVGQETGGYRYLKKNTAGQLVREFSLQGNSVIVVIHDYTRWNRVWADVQQLLQRCGPLLVSSPRFVRAVAVQFIDKFTWRVSDAPFPTKLVLRSDAKALSPRVLDETGDWHSQVGYITPVDTKADWSRSRIDNVNLSVSAESSFKSLNIFTLHRYMATTISKATDNFVSHVLPELFKLAHDDNKKLMRELLTEDVCKLIQLDAP
jgi:hypothetical protein